MATTANAPLVHHSELQPRPQFLLAWERHRHRKVHWVVESIAEAFGTFLYVYLGVGSTASYVIGNILGLPNLGSLLQIGLAYGFGVVLSLTICASTSGGHFSPCITLVFCAFKGFPWSKAPRYILSQLLGAYIASLIIYLNYKQLIFEATEVLTLKGTLDSVLFTSQGPAGIFALYVAPGTNLGYVLMNEFVTDVVLGMTIWACLDPTNGFVPPPAIPWVVGFAYAGAIWGYAPPGLAANSARDVGGRLMALTIWGKDAAGGHYAVLAALTNIVAMFVAAVLYEIVFTDSSRVVPQAQVDYYRRHAAHLEHRQHTHDYPELPMQHSTQVGSHGDEKSHSDHTA